MDKMKNYTCPKCNAPLMVPKGKETAYCEYCGSQIFIKDVKKEERERYLRERNESSRRILESKWFWGYMVAMMIIALLFLLVLR